MEAQLFPKYFKHKSCYPALGTPRASSHPQRLALQKVVLVLRPWRATWPIHVHKLNRIEQDCQHENELSNHSPNVISATRFILPTVETCVQEICLKKKCAKTPVSIQPLVPAHVPRTFPQHTNEDMERTHAKNCQRLWSWYRAT